MLARISVLIISGFFIAVAGCGLFVWFYNRYLCKMHETPIKKVIALTVLPAGCLLGLVGGLRLCWSPLGSTEQVAWMIPALAGVIVTAHFGWIHLSNKRYSRLSRSEYIHPETDQINWPYLAPMGAFMLRLLSPVNEATRLRIHRRTVELKGLHDSFSGYRIVHITDLHIHPTLTRSYYRRVVRETMRLKPDMILFGGDFISRHKYMELIPEFLSELSAPDGIWFVRGNHDFWKSPCRITKLARQTGMRLLSNEGITIRRNNAAFTLIGLDEPYLSITPAQRQRLRKLPHPRIGLVHTPDAYRVASGLDCQFAIAGHTHGGQVRLPFFGTTISGTNIGVRAADGAGMVNDMHTLTSNGQGAFFPLRVLCPPEIVLLTLQPLAHA